MAEKPTKRKKFKQNREKIVKKYGLTIEDYNNLLKKQGESCWICGAKEFENGKKLAIDHDHKNGKVRGLLCGKCNKGLGLFQDDPNILLKAMIYLQNNKI